MRALVEICVIAGTLAGFANWIFRSFFWKPRQKKLSNLEHVRQLNTENQEMDKILDDINSRKGTF